MTDAERIRTLEAAVLELLDRVRDMERAEQARVKRETFVWPKVAMAS